MKHHTQSMLPLASTSSTLHPELLWCSCFAKLPGLQVFYLILKLIHSTYFLLLSIIQSSTWNSSGEQADIVQRNQLLVFFSFQTENHYQKKPLFFFFKLSSYHHGPDNSSTANATVNISTRQQDKVLFQLNDRTPRIALEEYFTLYRNKKGQLWIDAWGPHTQSYIFHHSPIRKRFNKFSILIHAVKGTRTTVRKADLVPQVRKRWMDLVTSLKASRTPPNHKTRAGPEPTQQSS